MRITTYGGEILMKKKICLALCLSIGLSMPVMASGFSDVQSHWAQSSIELLVKEGIVGGYEDNTFRPDNGVTRAEIAAFLFKIFELDGVPVVETFSDVSANAWYHEAISAVTTLSFMNTFGDGMFYPSEQATREEVAFAIVQSYGLQDFEPTVNLAQTFSDGDSVSDWAADAVSILVSNNLMGGRPDGTLDPSGNITRAEVSTLLDRVMNVEFVPVVVDKVEADKVVVDIVVEADKAVDVVVEADTAVDVSAIIDAYVLEVFELVNVERAKVGIEPLELSAELNYVAQAKSEDMAAHNTLSHTSPVYGSLSDLYDFFGVDWMISAGENIAQGYTSPQAVVTGWMNSDGHRANILSDTFKFIGIGYEPNGNYWTQNFTGGLRD